MTKFDALHEIIGYIAINWTEGRDKLTPLWLYLLLEIAELASDKGWDRDRIIKEMEDRR